MKSSFKTMAGLLLLTLMLAGYTALIWVYRSAPSDFVNFYISGWTVLHHRSEILYDTPARRILAEQITSQLSPKPTSRILSILSIPIYGPQVALFFTPFALLPLSLAELVWRLLTFAVYLGCVYAFWRADAGGGYGRLRLLVVALIYPGFVSLISHSQTSALVLLAFTSIYFLLPKHPFLAGVAVGLVAYKPQFGLVMACVFVLTAQWKVVLGAISSSVGQVLVSGAVLGPQVWRDYILHLAQHASDQFHLDQGWITQMISLRSFWELVLPPHYAFLAYVVCALVVIAVTVVVWRSAAPQNIKFALLLTATLLASPHTWLYDFVIFLPALLITRELSLRRGSAALRFAFYGGFLLPLVSSQLAVAVMFLLCALLYRTAKTACERSISAMAPWRVADGGPSTGKQTV